MNNPLDKTAELENRLRKIEIIPENTCLFFRNRLDFVSSSRTCENCRYADFDINDKNGLTQGFCSFKAGRKTL